MLRALVLLGWLAACAGSQGPPPVVVPDQPAAVGPSQPWGLPRLQRERGVAATSVAISSDGVQALVLYPEATTWWDVAASSERTEELRVRWVGFTDAGPRALRLAPDPPRLVVSDPSGAAARRTIPLEPPAGHGWFARSLTVSRDGARVALADGATALVELDSGVVTWLDAGAHRVHEIVFSADGTRAFGSSMHGVGLVWDASTGELLADIAIDVEGARYHGHGVPSPDLSRVATRFERGRVAIWSSQGRLLHTLHQPHTGRIVQMRWSPDGQLLATLSVDRTVVLWDQATGAPRHRLEGHRDEVVDALFTRDGTWLVTRDYRGGVRIWSVADGELAHSLPAADAIALSAASTALITQRRDEGVRVWSLPQAEVQAELQGQSFGAMSRIGFADQGRAMVVSVHGKRAATLVWDLERGTLAHRLVGARWSLSPSGSHLVVDQPLRLIELPSGDEVRALGSGVPGTFIGEERFLTYDDPDITEWRVGAPEPVRAWAEPADVRRHGLHLAADGAAVGADAQRITVWEAATGAVRRHSPLGDWALRYAVTVDGAELLTLASPASLLVWSVPEVTQRLAVEPTAATYSGALEPSPGNVAVARTDGVVELRELGGGELLRTVGAPGDSVARVVAWEEERLVTGHDDGSVQLWHAPTGRPLARLEGHTGPVADLEFTPDGSRLVSSAADGVRIWNVATGAWLGALHAFDDGGWAVLSADGRFWSPEGADPGFVIEGAGALGAPSDAQRDPGVLVDLLGRRRR